MPQCPYIVHCPYFSKQVRTIPGVGAPYRGHEPPGMRSLSPVQQLKYCASTCYYCARYRAAEVLGEKNVPADLRPDQVAYAKEIIEKHTAQSLPAG